MYAAHAFFDEGGTGRACLSSAANFKLSTAKNQVATTHTSARARRQPQQQICNAGVTSTVAPLQSSALVAAMQSFACCARGLSARAVQHTACLSSTSH